MRVCLNPTVAAKNGLLAFLNPGWGYHNTFSLNSCTGRQPGFCIYSSVRTVVDGQPYGDQVVLPNNVAGTAALGLTNIYNLSARLVAKATAAGKAVAAGLRRSAAAWASAVAAADGAHAAAEAQWSADAQAQAESRFMDSAASD